MRAAIFVASGLLALCAIAPAASTATVRAGDVTATASATAAALSDSRVARTWRIDAGGVVTAALTDVRTSRNWSAPRSADFSMTLDGVATSSKSGWRLVSVNASPIPPDPRAARGAELTFRYAFEGLELDRTFSLDDGAAVIAVESRLVETGPAAARVGAYTLDELASPATARAEVQAYHGGSDWRDDFRHLTSEAGAFDDEAEVVRFDQGGAGWFFVAERRGGPMSRAGRDAGGRTWIGVDPARDLLDEGPLMSSPPNYNTQPNPAYPAPVRERTLEPGGTLELGRAYAGVYTGGAQAAAAAFVTDFTADHMPRFPRSVGLDTFHPWQHGPGMSDPNLRPQVDAARALGVETFMLDDQWQGKSAGDWRFDPSRFPGAPDFVAYLHRAGLKLGLWMSPLEFNPGSAAYAAHPDWACTPTGDLTAQAPDDSGLGVWDVTNPAFRTYLTGVVDRLIADYGVGELKFDYTTWVDCPPHDYLDYEDAFVALVRSFEARHPDVTFELDETNDQRMWPFESAALGPSWFDNGHLHGSTYPARLLHDIWTAAPWLAPSSIGFGTFDGTLTGPYTADYLMPMSLLGHLTFWTDLTKLPAAATREAARWIAWYERHRDDLAGLVYEDTAADPLDGRSWAAFQPWTGTHGYLFAFRQGGGPATESIRLNGLDARAAYAIRDARSGRLVARRRGSQLERGLAVTLPRPYSALVLAIAPARAAVHRAHARGSAGHVRRRAGGERGE